MSCTVSFPPGKPSCGSKTVDPARQTLAASRRLAAELSAAICSASSATTSRRGQRAQVGVGGVQQIELGGGLVPGRQYLFRASAPYFPVRRNSRSRRRSTAASRSGSSWTEPRVLARPGGSARRGWRIRHPAARATRLRRDRPSPDVVSARSATPRPPSAFPSSPSSASTMR